MKLIRSKATKKLDRDIEENREKKTAGEMKI